MKANQILFLLIFSSYSFQIQGQEIQITHNDTVRVSLAAEGPDDGGEIKLRMPNGNTTMHLGGNSEGTQGSFINMFRGDGLRTIQLDAHHYGGGEIFLNNTNGDLSMHLEGNVGSGGSGNAASLDMFDWNQNKRIHIGASDGIFGSSHIQFWEADGSLAFSAGKALFGGGNFNVRDASGNVVIAANGAPPNNGYHLTVDGKIISEELRIMDSANWPDYVFEPEYNLIHLDDLSIQIESFRHLPNIPKASDIEENGFDVGNMQKKQMEKIEELTLYIIQLHKRISDLENKIK